MKSAIQQNAINVYEKFIETLTEEQKIMFEEVLDKLFELNEELTKTDFEEGFKFGLNVVLKAIAAQ